jgi:hypothetical protein
MMQQKTCSRFTVDVPIATPVHIHPAVDSLSNVQKRRQGTALFIRALPVAGHWISVQLAHRRRQGGGTCSFVWELSINTAGPKNYDFSFLRSYKILHILKK